MYPLFLTEGVICFSLMYNGYLIFSSVYPQKNEQDLELS